MAVDVSEILSDSPLFQPPRGTRLEFHDVLENHLLMFHLKGEDDSCRRLYLKPLIHSEDAEHWKAFEDVLRFSIQVASPRLHGIYGYELLSADLADGIQNFDAKNFSQLLVNSAARLHPSEKRLIRYTRAFGLLQKRVNEDWGKLELKTHMSYFRGPVTRLDQVIKQVLRVSEKDSGNVSGCPIYIFHDLSVSRLFQAENEEQRIRVKKVLSKMALSNGEQRAEVYWHHAGKKVELVSHFFSENLN